MKSVLVTLCLTLTVFAVLPGARAHASWGDSFEVLKIGLGFSAKDVCSCLFVALQDENYCKKYVEIKQVQPFFKIDHEEKSVSASAYLLLWRTASYNKETRGCVLH
jgi:hypothetical protein